MLNYQSRMADGQRVLKSDMLCKGASGPIETALAYFALGKLELGLEWLLEGLHARKQVVFCKGGLRFDTVSSDPQYQALVARLKLPDAK